MHKHEWKNTPLKNGNFIFQTCHCGGMRWYWPNVAVYGMVIPKSSSGLEKPVGALVMSTGLLFSVAALIVQSIPLVLSVLLVILGGIIYLWREDDVPH